VGNPNTGKTSLFNALTGLNQQVGNYPGITVEKKIGHCKLPNDQQAEIIDLQQKHSLYRTQAQVGKVVEVLIEGTSKKSANEWMGRNTQNTVVVFPKENYKVGDFVLVEITNCTSTTLIGKAIKISDKRQ